MLSRRTMLQVSAISTFGALLPDTFTESSIKPVGPFRFCLNTSTISGQKPGLLRYIEIAASAGYDGIELWMGDIKAWLAQGNTIEQLATFIKANGIQVEDIISFTEWMVDDDAKRKDALVKLEKEMQLAVAIGCPRIAAPPAGVAKTTALDIQKAGDRYREILVLGKKYHVSPLLEFWGASGTLYNFGQALAIASAANDSTARILPDIYHLFRGGSGFDCLNLVSGHVIDIIHMNDYPTNKPVNEQTDADRIYPGDGNAPLQQVLHTLRKMGGTKVLSLELFNRTYWDQDPLLVARTGLEKMRTVVAASMKI